MDFELWILSLNIEHHITHLSSIIAENIQFQEGVPPNIPYLGYGKKRYGHLYWNNGQIMMWAGGAGKILADLMPAPPVFFISAVLTFSYYLFVLLY